MSVAVQYLKSMRFCGVFQSESALQEGCQLKGKNGGKFDKIKKPVGNMRIVQNAEATTSYGSTYASYHCCHRIRKVFTKISPLFSPREVSIMISLLAL